MRASTLLKWGAPPVAVALAAGVAFAGDETPPPAAASGQAAVAAKAEVSASATAKISAEGFLASLRLPVLAHETREKGVPDEDVKLAVSSLKDANVAPDDAVATLKETCASIDEKGPVENFGALVRSKIREGLRGRALAEAIHKEHEKRGIGKGKKLWIDAAHHRGLHLGHDMEAKAAHMMEHGKAEGEREHEGEHEKDREREHEGEKPADKAAKAADKAAKSADKAADKAAKAAEHHDEHGHGPGEGMPGKGKEK